MAGIQHTTSSNLVNKIITLIILLLVALVSISTLYTFVLEELLSTFGAVVALHLLFFISTKLLFPFWSSSPMVFFSRALKKKKKEIEYFT